jgi:diguanylate cyclase (GGDEF)-like protein
MEAATTPLVRNLKMVAPLQHRSKITATPPDSLGQGVLELTGVLQTTLEADQQIRLFARHISRALEFDGIAYAHETEQLDYSEGRQATHSVTYDLVLEGDSLGTLLLYRELPFADDEIHALENLLCALIYPLRNALVYRQAVQRALRDPLTGIPNRGAFEQALPREFELARRQGTALSLLIVDIDHFKRCNDRYGHSFGDDVLKAVAHSVSSTVRRSDLVFRFGGEEFLVLASHTAVTGARLLAERIRQNVETMTTISGRDMAVTVSVGVASLNGKDDPKTFFDRADAALYRAKADGRNRSCTS